MNTLTLTRALEAHRSKSLRPVAEEWEIAWFDGRTSRGFASEDAAQEYAVECGTWLDGHRVNLPYVYNSEGSRVGEIREVQSCP